jgi:hypothetical protein
MEDAMATSTIIDQAAAPSRKLSVLRLLVSGGVSAAVIFVICWIGTAVPYSSPTHGYISLFTAAEVNSVRALAEGSIWSLLFGGLSGGLFALIYNSIPIGRS